MAAVIVTVVIAKSHVYIAVIAYLVFTVKQTVEINTNENIKYDTDITQSLANLN